MTNIKSTKRALLMSVVALFLCFTMLMGTTYAWFTDSVTSTGNKIVAGNLDIDLYMWTDADTSVEITNESAPIFGAESLVAQNNAADTIWEPGKTQIVYLSIKNNGNLDLKYQVALEVKNVTNNLTDVVKYAITGDATYGTAPAWTNGISVVEGVNATQAENVVLGKGAEHHFALSVHMDEEAGNAYMNGSIEFDIKVLATQLNSEEDSFGKDYDAFAAYDGQIYQIPAMEKTVDTTAGETFEITSDDGAVIIKGTANGDAVTATVKPAESKLDGVSVAADGKEVVSYDIDVTGIDGVATTSIYLGKQLAGVVAYHEGEEMVAGSDYTYSYDPETGYVDIIPATYSVFDITYVLPADVTSADALQEKLNGATAGQTVNVSLANDIEVASRIDVPAGVTLVLDGNGHKIIANLNNAVINATNSNIEMKDLTITGNAKYAIFTKGARWENNGVNANVSTALTNAIVDLDKAYNFPVTFNGMGNIVMKDCVVTGAGLESGDYANGLHVFAGAEINLTVDGGNIGGIMLNSNSAAKSGLTAKNGAVINKVDVECSTAADGSLVAATISNDGAAINETLYAVYDAVQLDAAVEYGKVILAENITLDADDQILVSGTVLDGNGKTIDAAASKIDGMECALDTRGGVIKNLTITGPNARALGSGSNNVVTFVDDLYIDNVTIDYTYYAINGSIDSDHSVYVTNSEINGWISYAGLDLLSFKNTMLAKGNTTCGYGIGYLVVYGDTLIEDCVFDTFYMGVNTGALKYAQAAKEAGTPFTLTINNSYYKTADGDVKITADNFKTLLTDGNDARDFGRLLDNVVISVDGTIVE